ncbi:uncharacterized protein NMK_2583 [Novimethylophilus kurashikiensis]|uniref:Uncharacterized protein n=1 Tax=Novimethylophilus kurashikiensis TaxID=1825523 RepID=A0A2R5F9R9_9PROT|nr:glycosyltransferase [Novimethylophilus kurashikiensis]GBG14982.1 uncharacterized protein NMK_2583 [Novimethylophilus kurashikiensis]
MQTLKVLMSAYACEPDKGSEPGVGWRWALETAALGHEVWVITRANNRPGIEKALRGLTHAPRNLNFIYYDLPAWARWWKKGPFGVHLYYLLWQWGAYLQARKWHQTENFDTVHHITFGVVRHPSFMWRLGIPFVVGPVGGGERAPMELRKWMSLGGQAKEILRDAMNWLARFDPFVRQTYARASVILLKTPQSMAWLPAPYRVKARCQLEIGVERQVEDAQRVVPFKSHQALHILYVGRFLHWKGMDIGLRAIAEVTRRGIPVRLTMIGQGPERQRWQILTAHLKLAYCVTWVPWMPQHELMQAYRNFDALLFPSLHDSSGNVVLESMAGGLPVVCLGLGGPAEMVDGQCGRVVPVKDKSSEEVVHELADALAELAANPTLVRELRDGALARSYEYSWRRVVSGVWGEQGDGYRAAIQNVQEEIAYASA